MASALPDGLVSAQICDPVANLLDAMRAVAILIDAAQSGGARRPALCKRRTAPSLFSHGFGLSATMALGRALNDLPGKVIICSSISRCRVGPAETVSAPVAMAIPDLTAAVLNEIAEWTARGAE